MGAVKRAALPSRIITGVVRIRIGPIAIPGNLGIANQIIAADEPRPQIRMIQQRAGIDDGHDDIRIPDRQVPSLGQIDQLVVPLGVVKFVVWHPQCLLHIVRLSIYHLGVHLQPPNGIQGHRL